MLSTILGPWYMVVHITTTTKLIWSLNFSEVYVP